MPGRSIVELFSELVSGSLGHPTSYQHSSIIVTSKTKTSDRGGADGGSVATMAILHLFLSCQNTDMSVSLLLFFSDLFSRTKRSIISEESSEMGNLKTWREMQILVLYKQQTTGRDEKAGKFQERDNVRAREPISRSTFQDGLQLCHKNSNS
jgi:hypothetical protein